jgi:uncharacterized protein (DUF433 family)
VVDQAPDRFSTPLYNAREAALYLGVPTTTFESWAKGYVRRSPDRAEVKGAPVVTRVPRQRPGDASIPFIGLAEGLVLAAIRRSGVPLQRVRPALERLQAEIGLDHALASRQLYTDGAEVLYDFAQHSGDSPAGHSARQLVVVRNNQRVFNEVVEGYLHRVEFAPDGYAQVIRLPHYTKAAVVADPRRSFGQPVFARGGARVEDALGLFRAGESLATVSEEFGIPAEHLEDALRVATSAGLAAA